MAVEAEAVAGQLASTNTGDHIIRAIRHAIKALLFNLSEIGSTFGCLQIVFGFILVIFEFNYFNFNKTTKNLEFK